MTTPAPLPGPEVTSPRTKARVAGLFYLFTFIFGVGGLALIGHLVVSGDAAVTAANILAHPSLFRFNFAVNLLADACYIVVTALLYEIFRPVNKTVSLLAAFFSLVGCAVGALSYLFELAPLSILAGAPYLRPFTLGQLQSLALLFLKLDAQANNLSLVFFAFYCLLIGYLILHSTFLPKTLGALMSLAGLGWLSFICPPFATALYPYNLVPGAIGELSLTFWLLTAGLNAQRWHQQADSNPQHSA